MARSFAHLLGLGVLEVHVRIVHAGLGVGLGLFFADTFEFAIGIKHRLRTTGAQYQSEGGDPEKFTHARFSSLLKEHDTTKKPPWQGLCITLMPAGAGWPV